MINLFLLAFVASGDQQAAFDSSLKIDTQVSWDIEHPYQRMGKNTKFKYDKKLHTEELSLSADTNEVAPELSGIFGQFIVDWEPKLGTGGNPKVAYISVRVEAIVEGPAGATGSVEFSGNPKTVIALTNHWQTVKSVVLQPRFHHTGDADFVTTSKAPIHNAEAELALGTLRASNGGTVHERITILGVSLEAPGVSGP